MPNKKVTFLCLILLAIFKNQYFNCLLLLYFQNQFFEDWYLNVVEFHFNFYRLSLQFLAYYFLLILKIFKEKDFIVATWKGKNRVDAFNSILIDHNSIYCEIPFILLFNNYKYIMLNFMEI